MSDSQAPPQKSRVSDSELINAVEEQCRLRGTPVVPTKTVAESNHVNVTKQTIKRRLDDIEEVNSIKVGRGKVWWVPEENARGDIDLSAVYLEELEPEDVPTELVLEHPRGEHTGWFAWANRGVETARLSIMVFLAGFLLYLLRNLQALPEGVIFLAQLGIIGGFAMVIISLVVAIGAIILEKIEAPTTRDIWRRFLKEVDQRIEIESNDSS